MPSPGEFAEKKLCMDANESIYSFPKVLVETSDLLEEKVLLELVGKFTPIQEGIFNRRLRNELEMDVTSALKSYQLGALTDKEVATFNDIIWNTLRVNGIGGSEAGTLMEHHPKWGSKKEMYLKKIDFPLHEEPISIDKEYIFAYGHCNENFAADFFKKFYERDHGEEIDVIVDTKMYQHPKYPWMQANIDRALVMADGTPALLECKTAVPFKKDEFEDGNGFGIPEHYFWQVMHYMITLDIQFSFVVCVFGNLPSDIVYKKIVRADYPMQEEALINAEKEFWEAVQEREMPEWSSFGTDDKALLEAMVGPVEKKRPSIKLDYSEFKKEVKKYQQLDAKKQELKKQLEAIDEKLKSAAIPIMEAMGKSPKAYMDAGGTYINISYDSRRSSSVNKKLLENKYPEAYKECVTEGETGRIFSLSEK